MNLRKAYSHPYTQRALWILQRAVMAVAVILAVAFVLTVSVDLGPSLRELAEREGSKYISRPMHIGRLSVVLWNGSYRVEDLVIEGLTPQSPPFLRARLITVSQAWSTLLDRRVVLDSIEMTDWDMTIEYLPDGTHSFIKLPQRQPSGDRRWTTTLQHVRAHRGQFRYYDRGTPWSVIARNLDVTVARPGSEYIGKAAFSDGLVSIQSYVPFRADMDTTFRIDGGRVVFDAINLATDGTRSVLEGDVNLSHWPEQMYSVKSTIDLPRMRQLFFANDNFELAGGMEFDGVFHLFKGDVRPDGTTRGGRELKGNFRSATAYVNDYRFDDLAGYVRWIPDALEVHDASARLYGGTAQFEYAMAPLGVRDRRPTNRFDALYQDVDLTQLSDFFELQGIRFAGRISGTNELEWPSGGFASRRWEGIVRATPPPGVDLMTRAMPSASEQAARAQPADGEPFSPHTPREPVPIGGEVTYSLGPEWVDIAPSRFATETTYVEIEGRTAYGERSRMPFHVSSSDWQESDRLFAGILTAFGSPTRAIPVGGYGTFDGVMLNAFRRPRIEGMFAGEQMRAFDVTWGTIRGNAAIENSYADVTDVLVTSGDSSIRTEGRFSLGFPRRDGGEQINARITVDRRPLIDLKQAFGIDDYDVDGTFSGEFHVFGEYLRPFGFGRMGITEGTAYGESFDTATASVLLEGEGVRLDNIELVKRGGRGSGAAFVGFDGTYSFDFEARNLGVETLDVMAGSTLPLSGLIELTANGSGAFATPRYEVHATVRDLFIADEGIGLVVGDLGVNGDVLTVKLDAASTRLAVFGGGQITMNDSRDAQLSFSVIDTSLDPYIRAFEPRLSPYTCAVASGTLRVNGALADLDRLVVDAIVDRLDLRLFDYALRNAPLDTDVTGAAPLGTPAQVRPAASAATMGQCAASDAEAAAPRRPIRLTLDRNTLRLVDMLLVGDGTRLNLSGVADLRNERIAMRAGGDANLGILQAFTRNISSTGHASLDATIEGPLRDPQLTGKMTVDDGRIRHFSLPHAFDELNGVVTFDTRGIRLDELTAEVGGGDVTFGGTIGIEEYQPGRIDVTVVGSGMALRFPRDMRSTVDADLALQGTIEAMRLSGVVTVRQAIYTGNFDAGPGFLDFGGDQRVSVPSVEESAIPVSYDIRIRVPSSLQVRNDIMKQIVASADLQLAGTFARPLLFGRVDIERGELEFEGKRYVIRRGTIDFNNPTRIEPFFDIETEAQIRVPGETYRVTVSAVGTNPIGNLRFSSEPELPQYELLALLVADIPPGQDVEFRQYQDVTPQEQLLRERVSRALTGVVSAEVGRVVEQALGCDTFQLTTSLIDPNQRAARLDPAARVTCGKRLSARAFLTYSRSLSSTTRDQIIMLEIDQTDQLSWILSRNEDGTYALDLRVRRTF